MNVKSRPEFYKLYSWAARVLGMVTTENLMFAIIYSFHESERECYISIRGFATLLDVDKSTVLLALKRLQKLGAVEVGGSNFMNSNSYTINESVVEAWKRGDCEQTLRALKQEERKAKKVTVKANKEQARTVKEAVPAPVPDELAMYEFLLGEEDMPY